MKRAFSTLCCLDYSFEEVLSLAKNTGMDAVELRVEVGRLCETLNSDDVGRLFREGGIQICDVATSVFIRSAELDPSAYEYVDFAAKLGSPAIRVFAGESAESVTEELKSDIDGIATALKKLCEYAEKQSVEVWLETHSELSTGRACRIVYDKVGKSNFKILWDVLHSIEYGEPLDVTLDYIGHAVSHVHLKDGVPSENKLHYTHTDLGKGSFPFAETVRLLREAGYDGYLSLEWESPWCPEIRDLYSDPADLLRRYNKVLTSAGA